ncbi:hypothetical protein E2C01_084018 [Portunus trituberculatus]|uniref:Uncharacterized protein n=1 Tax=Portunus trituberculatus TaxID=210409 RepID=A0A5B7J825_PORTR|nr:hypothetical protein [Portunus trituberculatus]
MKNRRWGRKTWKRRLRRKKDEEEEEEEEEAQVGRQVERVEWGGGRRCWAVPSSITSVVRNASGGQEER